MLEAQRAGAVLVLADEPAVRDVICQGLEHGAYRVCQAGSASEALDAMGRGGLDPALVVVRLANGCLEFVAGAREVDPALGIVVLAGGRMAGAAELSGREGITVLGEPFDNTVLLGAVEGLLRRRLARITEVEWRERVEGGLMERHTALERRLEKFAAASLDVLVTALEARDPFMSGHSMRVAQLSASLADALGRTEEEVESVRLAGRLHDIGMTVISEQILNRKGPLTPAEREQIRQHPLVGHQLLQPYTHLREVASFVRGHHERWDGGGYPDGLRGEEIPWGARILAVTETYDALVTSRAYSERVLTPSEARTELQSEAGVVLDPAVVAALAGVVGKRRTLEFVDVHIPEEFAEVAPLSSASRNAAFGLRDRDVVRQPS